MSLYPLSKSKYVMRLVNIADKIDEDNEGNDSILIDIKLLAQYITNNKTHSIHQSSHTAI